MKQQWVILSLLPLMPQLALQVQWSQIPQPFSTQPNWHHLHTHSHLIGSRSLNHDICGGFLNYDTSRSSFNPDTLKQRITCISHTMHSTQHPTHTGTFTYSQHSMVSL